MGRNDFLARQRKRELVRSVREIRLALAEALAEGCEYIRNQECDNFDPKRGCLGHPMGEDT